MQGDLRHGELQVHSKLCLITSKDKSGTHYITQVGTGNYNEKTSALYTDLSVMTASPVIGPMGRPSSETCSRTIWRGSTTPSWWPPKA